VELRTYGLHLLRIAVLAGLYLLLAESSDVSEIVVALASGVVANIAIEAVARHSPAKFSFEAGWLRSAIAMPARIVKDSILVLGAAPAVLRRRRPVGEFVQHNVRHKGAYPGSGGWRAWTIIDVSVAPNTYAVRIGERHYRMLIHRLVGSPDA
jgi:hypothetical protein